ncbi:alpha-amylase family glycosyl hydrolase [Spirochaeta lutea]|uniref:alpha-amylase family glycosyl hydrolase n=1 Tax=Spirochaeta lutea TaxID=1480694 RepID=UPI00068DC710|nr:alpha-amylase family glycosyl hydrolase [Spirochaeta lutea]
MNHSIDELWESVYGDSNGAAEELRHLKTELERFHPSASQYDTGEISAVHEHQLSSGQEPAWYQEAVVYALYTQHFNKTFTGLSEKLDHLAHLGVTCLWLLPILDSPMRDEGFDVSDFYSIRPGLFPDSIPRDLHQAEFRRFLQAAHEKGIRVIFDIALNHISIDHPWFQKAVSQPESPEFSYFHWSDTGEEHEKARIIFKGMLESNWEYEPRVGKYYFHRFYPHQPDLNYENPRLLREVIQACLYWIDQGVDGFRVDAAPYFWKDADTDSENHPNTHMIIKILRAAVEAAKPGTLLLAEACQPPRQVVDYFGQGDECQGAYHFPLMPRLFLSLAEGNGEAIKRVLSPEVTPQTPQGTQWFTFLRCHDELTLEMVTPQERETIYDYYCKDPSWDFRQGEGISSRLINLLETPQKVLLAHALLLGLSGTPVIYYGDEVLTPNNQAFNLEWRQRTGYTDSRNLVRGPLDWPHIEEALKDPASPEHWHYNHLSQLIHARRQEPAFALGDQTLETGHAPLLLIVKQYQNTVLHLWYNLSEQPQPLGSTGDSRILAAYNHDPATHTLGSLGFLWSVRS